MENLIYYSRNSKKAPFEVTIDIQGSMVSINCNCELGLDKKICRHKINAIRGDKENRHQATTDETISRLRHLFGTNSTLRQHLEEKWRALREFASQYPDEEINISNKRKLLGETFANGFKNENSTKISERFDADEWEANRLTLIDKLNCQIAIKYTNHEGIEQTRNVLVNEVFSSNSHYYLLGYCSIRNQTRTFRVDRIQGIDFGENCNEKEISLLLDVVFQGRPKSLI